MAIALVVQSDVAERVRSANLLRKVAHVSTMALCSLREAEEAMASEMPAVVLVDEHLPDGTAGSLVERVRRSGAASCVVVVRSPDEPAVELPADPRVHVVERPIDERRLKRIMRRAVRATWERHPLFHPSEYVQLLGVGGHSAVLECMVDGERCGEIFVFQGEVVDAADCRGREGLEAAYELLGREDALALARAWPEDRVPERRIRQPWEHLLLEAVRRRDEAEQQSVTGLPAASDLDDAAEAHVRAASKALMSGDLAEAARRYAEAARIAPDDAVIRYNLERLERLGYSAAAANEPGPGSGREEETP